MNLLAANEITPVVRRWKPYPAYKDSGVEWLGSVPSHWEMTNLKRIGTFQAGTGFPVEDQGRTEGQIPFYKVSDMNAEGNELWMSVHSNTVDVPIAERLGATVVAPNTIVFPKVGATLLTNKRRILKVPSCIDNNMMGFAPRKVDVMWMYYWLLGLDLGRLANPGAVPSINESQLREIPIALPIDIEQHAIVATLDRETAKIDALWRRRSD